MNNPVLAGLIRLSEICRRVLCNRIAGVLTTRATTGYAVGKAVALHLVGSSNTHLLGARTASLVPLALIV